MSPQAIDSIGSRSKSATSLINNTPGVAGGDACIRSTRLPVWTLVALHRSGRSDAELVGDFPGITRTDLSAAWDYHCVNKSEIDEASAAENVEDWLARFYADEISPSV